MIVLETERLILRHMRLEDLEALFATLGDPVTMKYYPHAFLREDVTRWIERSVKSYEENGYGLYAMVLRETGTVIGDCGHARQEVEGRAEIEIGYHVQREHWRKGYATEAARGALAYGFETLHAKRLISLIRPENIPSRRVAEKMGMGIEKEVLRQGIRHFVYSIAR
ncbi:MAG TPA: GNAT family N-acetyltransferase [Candidatus Acidoferrales bacterium]|nr:GNAT family N-acetyltransferase [Candidatus Acidoferrales bacterium]